MKGVLVISAALMVAAFSTNVYSQNVIEKQFKIFQEAILQRDEIIRKLIKRIELLEGEVKTIKNKDKIQQIVEESLNRQLQLKQEKSIQQTSKVESEKETKSSEGTLDKNKQSVADQAFERQLLDRGGLVLPLYASVVDLGFTTINSATDSIVVDGFTIFPVLVIGDIVSERVRRDVSLLSVGWRIGLPKNLQLESKLSWNYLNVSRVTAESEEESFYDTGYGDIELGLSYQWTDDHEWLPDSLVALRWKSKSGEDPYEFPDPGNHVTGSGFDALNIFYTATASDDPLAFYGGFSYTHNLQDRKSAGLIKLGDTLGFSIGTSLAINLKSSLSLGFSQSWTEKTELNKEKLSGTNLTTANLSIGFSYAISQKISLNTSLGIGLTEDSPDFQFGFNVPIRFGF